MQQKNIIVNAIAQFRKAQLQEAPRAAWCRAVWKRWTATVQSHADPQAEVSGQDFTVVSPMIFVSVAVF